MQSLRDKLLKAGLVSEEAAKKAEAEKPKAREPRRDERPAREERRDARPPRRDEGADHDARLPKFAPLAGSKEAHRQQAKKQLESDRQLRERVLATQVPIADGATTFYFVTRKNKLRRLSLSEAQAKQLESGELAVVERPDPDRLEHALVPAAVARELLVEHTKAVRFLNAPGAAVGFLSEGEIAARAHEAAAPETAEAPAAPQPADAGEPAPTFITIKRAPKP